MKRYLLLVRLSLEICGEMKELLASSLVWLQLEEPRVPESSPSITAVALLAACSV